MNTCLEIVSREIPSFNQLFKDLIKLSIEYIGKHIMFSCVEYRA